jgi:hypothetical protein
MLMNIKNLKALILKMPKDVSIMISGPPGIGKTDLTGQIAKEEGAEHVVYLASTMDPTDLVGVPFPNEKARTTVFYPPEALMRLTESARPEDRGPMIACFDDITTADDHVAAALFRLFQHREVAGNKIRANVRLIGTGNRAEDKAAAKDMPTALNNRFWHADLNVNVDEWRMWAVEHKIQPSIVGYIAHRPEQLHQFKPENVDRAFATPRSVAMASRMQEAVGIDSSLLHEVIAGCVGEAWAVQYGTFLKNTEHLIKPEEIMKDPKTARVPKSEQIDVIHATLASLTYHVSNNVAVDTVLKAFTYAQRIPHADMGMVCVHQIIQGVITPSKDANFKAKIIGSPVFNKLIEEHGYMIN